MKNREERLAQILRKGEKMKRRHKKRQLRALLTCTPLILCAVLYVSFVLPAMMPAGAAPENAGEAPEQIPDGSALLQAVSIRVETPEEDWTLEDPAQVEKILRCLAHTVFVYEYSSAQSATGGITSTTNAPPGEPTQENKEAAHLSLTLILQDGTQQQYLLTGTSLTEKKTGKQHTVTKMEYEYLRMLLEREEKDVEE